MAEFLAHKVIAALPSTLEPDAVYVVRVGLGVDVYFTDATGSVAYTLNGLGGARVHVGTSPPSDTTMLWVDTT